MTRVSSSQAEASVLTVKDKAGAVTDLRAIQKRLQKLRRGNEGADWIGIKGNNIKPLLEDAEALLYAIQTMSAGSAYHDWEVCDCDVHPVGQGEEGEERQAEGV